MGSAAVGLGALAAMLDHWEDAAAHFQQAVAVNERIGATPFLAVALREHARALLRRGGNPDRAEAGFSSIGRKASPITSTGRC